MDRRFDLIVFDWDGTLMDSTPHIAQSFLRACADLDLPPPTLEQANWIIGMGLAPALELVLPDLPAADYPRLSAAYRRHFLAEDAALPLFPGTADLVTALADSGHLLAVATGKTRQGLERAFDQSGLRPHFHASCCADESFAKPNPAMLMDVMTRTGVDRRRTLMIGDTTHDLQLAANAGVSAVGVTYGAHPQAALAQQPALALVASTLELRRWLEDTGQLPPAGCSGQAVAV
jgi:phosphoglycolate phosphatase